MSTIKSSDEHLTLNADGASKDIKFQANGVEKASISSAGAFTSTTIDATKLTGTIPNFTSTGIDDNADATAITIDSSEKVGIGTTSPACVAKGLHIQTSSAGTLPTLQADADDVVVEGSTPGITLMGATNGGGMLAFGDTDDADVGQIFYYHVDNSMRFKANDVEGLRINNNGRVSINKNGLGTNFGDAACNIGHTATTPLLELHVNHTSPYGCVKFMNGNGEVGSIGVAASATSFNTSSDYRLKENVDYDWDATTRLKQLKPARFNFISDDTNTLVDGFIAHEVSSVVPEAITGEKDAMTEEVLYVEGDDIPEGKSVGDVKTAAAIDPQGIDQSKLVPLLVKTIQELEARIAALEA